MAALAFDIKGSNGEINFSDVDSSAWYAQYVYSLASAGVINGRGNGEFGVGDYITREEIAVILDRIAEFKGISLTAQNEMIIKDADKISPYAVSALEKMCSAGVINGFGDGNIKPQDNASRAQTAQLIYKVIKLSK